MKSTLARIVANKTLNNEIPPQNDSSDDTRPKIWLRIPFMGKQGEFLVKKLLKKIQRNLTQPVKFVVIYGTKKISYFLPKKDKIPKPLRSNIVYEFTCPGCNSSWPPDYRNTQIHKKVRFLNICRNVNTLITSLT